MAQIDFRTFQSRLNNTQTQSNFSNGARVNFFSLKNDKDEAIVRFMIDSEEDFNIVLTHPMKVGGFTRSVNCLRDLSDTPDKCPLCAANKPAKYKFFIKLIEYVRGEDGKIVPTPKVWERSTTYVDRFSNLLAEYGPLSEGIFKIKRSGKPGDRDTQYDIFFCSPNVYNETTYPKRFDLFDGYKLIGSAVVNKTYEELCDMLAEENSGEAEEQIVPKKTVNEAIKAIDKQIDQSKYDMSHAYPGINQIPSKNESEIPFDVAPAQPQAPNPYNNRQPNTPSANNAGFGRPRRFY